MPHIIPRPCLVSNYDLDLINKFQQGVVYISIFVACSFILPHTLGFGQFTAADEQEIMSEMQQGSSDCARMRRADTAMRAERASRRTWTPQEESVLLASLKELVANGWKSDNGFRGGYLQRLEDAIATAFPGTDLKGTPHINSKLQNWKRNYYSLSLMLARSGVGFNADGNHTIDCIQEQWEQIVKCDANAKTMRFKSWPMYEDWKEVFGKDRANGESAEDIMDAVNELNKLEKKAADSPPEGDDYHPNVEDINLSDETGDTSINNFEGAAVKMKDGKGKKRVADPTMVFMGELFGEISRSTNARLDRIAASIGYDKDLDQWKQEAFLALEKIEGLSIDDKFTVCEIFAEKTSNLLVFKGLPDSAKAQYVQCLIRAKAT